jgi:shikimate kinase
MNIVLIGYRGTGKTAVARKVAETTGRELVNMDALIVERVGCSVPEYVQAKGWDDFRDRESEVARDVGARDGLVVDTGGGVVLRQENIEALWERGVVFWLTASVATIQQRIEMDDQRPSLTGSKSFVEEVAEVLAIREPIYRAAADHIIGTDDRTVDDVADEVCRLFAESTDVPERRSRD